MGAWELTIDRAGAYDITARFDPATKAGTARLRWGDNTLTQPVAPGDRTAHFGGVHWPVGTLRLEATIELGDRAAGVQYVEIHAPPNSK